MGSTFALNQCSFIDMRQHLRKAWNQVVHAELCAKKQYRDCFCPDVASQQKLWKTIPPATRRSISPVIATGVQTEVVKAKYLCDQDDKCKRCGLVDTLEHQLSTCEEYDINKERSKTIMQAFEVCGIHACHPVMPINGMEIQLEQISRARK